MKRVTMTVATAAVLGTGLTCLVFANDDQKQWAVHDETRPRPAIIQPGTVSTPEQPGKAPSDAIILFDGKDLSHWRGAKGEGDEPKWKLEDGAMVADKEYIFTKDKFGDVQLHAEFATPSKVEGTSQGRGNSGIFFMENYEVQVLDSYDNVTYADGQCAALYGQYPPLVNASLPPAKWQTYDIVFHRPHFGEGGKVSKPATVTVFHNGVLVQDNAELKGTTAHKSPGVYTKHDDKLPIKIQFHGNPARFRNIWIRPLEK